MTRSKVNWMARNGIIAFVKIGHNIFFCVKYFNAIRILPRSISPARIKQKISIRTYFNMVILFQHGNKLLPLDIRWSWYTCTKIGKSNSSYPLFSRQDKRYRKKMTTKQCGSNIASSIPMNVIQYWCLKRDSNPYTFRH